MDLQVRTPLSKRAHSLQVKVTFVFLSLIKHDAIINLYAL